MNVNADFICQTDSKDDAFRRNQVAALSFSQVAYLAAEADEPSCRVNEQTQPFTFIIPAIQMFGSINRRIE